MERPEIGETFTAEVDRISSSGNAIIDWDDSHINLGPLSRDCVGEVVEAVMYRTVFARCETDQYKRPGYQRRFLALATSVSDSDEKESKVVESISNDEKHEVSVTGSVEFCDRCNSIMRTNGESWSCSSCDFSKPKSGSKPDTDPDTTPAARDIDHLRTKAEENAVENIPKTTSTSSKSRPEYTRSQAVAEYVKARADGVCEGCGESAPFVSKTGDPYLHAHHIHELGDGGSDTPDTVIALCPNCHYRVHHGQDGEKYNKELLETVQSIENQ